MILEWHLLVLVRITVYKFILFNCRVVLYHLVFSVRIYLWGIAPLTTGKTGKGGIAYE